MWTCGIRRNKWYFSWPFPHACTLDHVHKRMFPTRSHGLWCFWIVWSFFYLPFNWFFAKVIFSSRSPKHWAAKMLMRRARRHLLPRLDVCFVNFNKPQKQAEGEELMQMFVHFGKLKKTGPPKKHHVTTTWQSSCTPDEIVCNPTAFSDLPGAEGSPTRWKPFSAWEDRKPSWISDLVSLPMILELFKWL